MADITVSTSETESGWTAHVTVAERGSSSSHAVTIDEGYYEQLTDGEFSPEQLVETSFEFLLEREPKESILSSFDLPTISRYFPEYERDIGRLLEKKYG